jgi:hypothetical protein
MFSRIDAPSPLTSHSTGLSVEASVPSINIQVEGPDDLPESRATWTSKSLDIVSRSSASAYSGGQTLAIYHLSSLVSPLVSAALVHIVPPRASSLAIDRLRRLLESLLRVKNDIYLDILDIVAYGNSESRVMGLRALSTYWPKAVGYPLVGLPLPQIGFQDAARSRFKHIQQYIPWQFPRKTISSETASTVIDTNICERCGRSVEGFGLLCISASFTPHHLDCLNSNDHLIMSQYATETGVKVAAVRFCHVPHNPKASVFTPLDGETTSSRYLLVAKGHTLRLVNVFQLVLCFVCRKPLWGIVAQGYKCDKCHGFAHGSCLDHAGDLPVCSLPAETGSVADIRIDWDTLRRGFLAYYSKLAVTETDVLSSTTEDIMVLHSVLALQLSIVESGIAGGTVAVQQAISPMNSSDHIDPFELSYLAELYDAYLRSDRLTTSAALEDYLSSRMPTARDLVVSDQGIFSIGLLSFIVALLRSPLDYVPPSSSLLQVQGDNRPSNNFAQSLEAMETSLMRDILVRDFGLHSEIAFHHLIEFIHQLGFLARADAGPLVFPPAASTSSTTCVFPVPLLVDASPCVETLVVAIEKCLSDHDLTVQEHGFLLLVRRCWPDAYSSRYALERLTRAVAKWIVDDSQLFEVARDTAHAAKARTAHEKRSSMGPSGASYLHVKGRLAQTYAARWLRELHDDDPFDYAEVLFAVTASISAEAEAPSSLYLAQSQNDGNDRLQARLPFFVFKGLVN